jgi:hypothetical protein
VAQYIVHDRSVTRKATSRSSEAAFTQITVLTGGGGNGLRPTSAAKVESLEPGIALILVFTAL